MTPEIYSPLALRTAKRFDDAHGDFIHAALGLASEIAELGAVLSSTDRVIDEAGDMLWYLNLACVSQSIPFGAAPPTDRHSRLWLYSLPGLLNELTNSVSVIADMAKKLMVTGKLKRPGDVEPTLTHIYCTLTTLLKMHAATIPEALAGNITKLAVRYPELAFDADRALNADHGAEAKAVAGVQLKLEGGL